MSNPQLYEIVYDEIAEKVIMKYKKLDEARIDDVTLSNEPLLQDEV